MRVSKILYHNICYMPIAKHLRILTFSKIQACCLCLYWTWFYWTNIYQWYFYTYWNIHQEVFHTFTLSSMTQLNDGLLFHEIIHQTLKPRNELQRLDLAMRHRDEHKAVFLPLLQLETIQFNRSHVGKSVYAKHSLGYCDLLYHKWHKHDHRNPSQKHSLKSQNLMPLFEIT